MTHEAPKPTKDTAPKPLGAVARLLARLSGGSNEKNTFLRAAITLNVNGEAQQGTLDRYPKGGLIQRDVVALDREPGTVCVIKFDAGGHSLETAYVYYLGEDYSWSCTRLEEAHPLLTERKGIRYVLAEPTNNSHEQLSTARLDDHDPWSNMAIPRNGGEVLVTRHAQPDELRGVYEGMGDDDKKSSSIYEEIIRTALRSRSITQ